MSFDRYFRDELSFLKEQGGKYSELRPHLARYLQSSNKDPDVERLLEGFAFLTSRLREKVDDDFPELTHSMINLLWPNFLRPFPSMTIAEFTPLESAVTGKKTIEAGRKLSSKVVKGTSCLFKTTRDVHLYPLVRDQLTCHHTRETSSIEMDFKTHDEIALQRINLDALTFFLGETSYESQNLYLWLNHFLKSIKIVVNGDYYDVPIHNLESIGWKKDEGILPYPKNVYEGYRLLHEYLAFPDAFSFVSVKNIQSIFRDKAIGNFKLIFNFTRPLPADIRVNENHMRLYCVPAINLFAFDAEPIDLTGEKTEYRVFPAHNNRECYEIFSVDQVMGWDRKSISNGAGKSRRYTAFESFEHEIERVNNRSAQYYRVRVKDAIDLEGFDYFMSFVRSDELTQVKEGEAISMHLTCTNRDLPLELGKGDLNVCEQGMPEYVSVRNITDPTAPLYPALDGTLQWTLISNLSLNYLSLISKDALRTIIRAYDFRALNDRQAERISQMRIEQGIVSINTRPTDRIFKGAAIRGIESILVLDEKAFANEGDLYLFASVLSHFFSLYASINSFHDLIVINQETKEEYNFKTQMGSQPLI